MSDLHYIFKVILNKLCSNSNSCGSPNCLQRLYNICHYSLQIGGGREKYFGFIQEIDGGKILSLDAIVIADRIISPNERFFTKYKVHKLSELKKKLKENSRQLIKWSIEMYGIDNPTDTPLIELQKEVNAGGYDSMAVVFFVCFMLDMPWLFSDWETEDMTFNGNEDRDGITSTIDGGVKIGTWGDDTFVINIPVRKSSENVVIYLTILLPKIHHSEVLSGKNFQASALLQNMQKKFELSGNYTPLELLKRKFIRASHILQTNKRLEGMINYLINGRDKQILNEKVKITMPRVEAENVKMEFRREDFANVGDQDAAKMFDPGRMKAFTAKNPDVALDCMKIRTTTKITEKGIHVKAIGEAFLVDGIKESHHSLRLDITHPFMYIIGTDANNIYSIGFVNE